MKVITINSEQFKQCRIELRQTPWDSEVLEVPTMEIIEVVCPEKDAISQLISDTIARLRMEHTQFCSVRVPSGEQAFIDELQRYGFRYVETSLRLLRTGCVSWPGIDQSIAIRPATPSDHDDISVIARTAFDFGRFHEDPMVSRDQACARMYNWAKDMLRDGTEFLVQSDANGVVSFMAFKIAGQQSAELLLGGSRRGQGLASVWFWAAVLKELHRRGVNRISTNISASNHGVANLYFSNGFRVVETLVGLHWRPLNHSAKSQ